MILGTIISAVSAFFIHNHYQPYCFAVGCVIFIIGASLRFKEEKESGGDDD